MKSPWTIAIEVDDLHPTINPYTTYGRTAQIVRPLMPGNKVFLFSQPGNGDPAYGRIVKIETLKPISRNLYQIKFEDKRKRK